MPFQILRSPISLYPSPIGRPVTGHIAPSPLPPDAPEPCPAVGPGVGVGIGVGVGAAVTVNFSIHCAGQYIRF